MTIDDDDEGDAEEVYCEGARRILRVIASASRVSHGNRITKLDIFVTRGKRGRTKSMIGDGTTRPSKARRKEEEGLGTCTPTPLLLGRGFTLVHSV